MKTRRSIRVLLAAALTGSLLTQLVSAAPLPNAWQITHNTTASTSTLIYTNQLTLAQHAAATNNPTGGFRFTVNARFVTDYNDGDETMTMSYGLGDSRFLIWWGLTNNNLTARLENGPTYTLTTNGTGRTLYHTHEIIYNPTSSMASYVFDGVVKATNWVRSANNSPAGRIAWGAGSSTSKGQMNFNHVTFAITNLVVAEYNAGTEPTNAPDPRTQGWTNSPSIPPTGTGTNGISPDRGQGVVTTLADGGYGSLRQNLADARSGDTISFFTNGTIVLTSSELFLTNSLTISGPGPASLAISGNNARRVFEIDNGITARISGLTILDGNNSTGGGIHNEGTLTVADCTLFSNSSVTGGGIYNDGTLMVTNCSFLTNSASGSGGGIFVVGGTLTLVDSTFSGNSALNSSGNNGGGGVCNSGGAVTVTNCTFSGNDTAGFGGGLYNNASILTVTHATFSGNSARVIGGGIGGSNGGTNMVADCTFSGNSADSGGGIGIFVNGTNTVANCTFSNNSATNYGGGIYSSVGTNTVNHCTFSDNSAYNGGGIYSYGGRTTFADSTLFGNSARISGGGIYMDSTGVNVLKNCTLSGNTATNSGGGIYKNAGSCALTNTIVAGNISTNSANITNFSGTISGVNNLTNGAPLLAPLGNYGGPTQTMPPLAGSPAIDAGLDSITNSLTTDQRGYPRKSGAHVDIGAVEFRSVVVLNTNDTGAGSLRAAIAGTADLITFTNTLSGQTIHLTSGHLTPANSFTINASSLAGGVIIDAGGTSRVLEITNADVTLDSLILTNGRVPNIGGGILVDGGAKLTLTNCLLSGNSADTNGGGIYNAGTVMLYNSTISANACASDNGGGICNLGMFTINGGTVAGNNPGGGIANYSGPFVINNSTVSANTAIFNSGGIGNSGGTLVLNNSTLTGNSAGARGGGLRNSNAGLLTISNSAVSGNTAGISGGGLYNDTGSTLTLINSIVSGNVATNNGGGVVNNGASGLAITNCSVSSNSAGLSGGGLYNDGGSTMALINSVVSNNSATNSGGAIVLNSSSDTSIINSTLSGNVAGSTGGGIIIANSSTVSVRNSTVSDNHSGGNGGGINNASGAFALINSTFVGNAVTSGTGGGIYQNGLAGLSALTNTIVAGNTVAGITNNLAGAVGPLFIVNCLTSGNPLLVPFGNYGGPTQTMPPLAGSPAIDAGLDSITNLLATDQRGYPRKSGAHVDIGAVEFRQSVVVNANDNGAGSLRNAIQTVSDLITFTNSLSGQTIHLTSGQLTVSNSLAIDASSLAAGVLIDAGGNSRVFEITNANVTFDSLTLTNGIAFEGGGIHVNAGAALAMNDCLLSGNSAGYGGGVGNDGTVTILSSIFSGNSATSNGGGFYNNQGILAITNGIVIGNSAIQGGGIYNFAATLTVADSSFSGNSVTANGGGISSQSGSTVMLNYSTLSGNSATNNGGGIANNSSMLTVNNSVVSDNSAGTGAGIYNANSGTITANNSSFFRNSASGNGGAINDSGSTLAIINSTLAGNSADGNGGGIFIVNSGAVMINNSTLSVNHADGFGGGIANNSGTFALNSSTLSGNSTDSGTGSGGGIYQNGLAGLSALTNTIVAGNTTSGVANNLAGAIGALSIVTCLTSGNPLLAQLGNYGGYTQTMPPLSGSPAIDAGLDSITNSLPTDQRGYPRKSGAHVDIGAVESQLAPMNNRPLLLNLAMQANGAFQFSFTNVPNADFTVLTSTNVALPSSQWTPLGLATQSPPGQYQFTDAAATNYPQRFYQTVSP